MKRRRTACRKSRITERVRSKGLRRRGAAKITFADPNLNLEGSETVAIPEDAHASPIPSEAQSSSDVAPKKSEVPVVAPIEAGVTAAGRGPLQMKM